MQPAEAEGGEDMQRPLDPARAGGHLIRQRLDLGQDAARAIHQIGALCRQPKGAPAPLDQPKMQPVLDQRQPLRHRGRRHVQAARRGGKAGRGGQGDQEAKVGQVQH
jgi:hypothetical protein